MILKEQILNEINKTTYHPLDIHEWATLLNCTETQSFKDLIKTMNEMVENIEIAQDKKDRYISIQEAGIIIGKLSINPKGFGFVDCADEESGIYVNEKNMVDAMNGDEVAAKKVEYKSGDRECSIIKVLKRNTTHLIGTIHLKRGIHVSLENKTIHSKLKLTNASAFHLIDGYKVLMKIVQYGKCMHLEIEKILGHKDDPGMDILSILLEHNIESDFPEDVMKQAEAIDQTVSAEQKKGRTDLTHRTIVTIDGNDSKDFDDAISIERTQEGFKLGVHIADVSYYVTENSPLDNEARRRGTSVYVVDRVVPMLPQLLSNGICSLNPHVVRLTLTCDMEINQSGEVASYQIYPSYIKSTERMTYENVNRILDQDPELCNRYRRLGSLFEDMQECASLIRKRRESLGSISFDKEEAVIQVNENGDVLDIFPRERGESERMIEDFMVCANECVAAHMKWMEIPSLYRIHEQPELKKAKELARVALIMGYRIKGGLDDLKPNQIQEMLEVFKDEDCYPALSLIALRSMQKAKYDSHCLGHFGLALKEYTHFTSPIRRYPDLIVHRMLRKYFFDLNADKESIHQDEILMEELADETSICERIAIEAEREVEDMKKAEYMLRFVGKYFDGIISGVTKFGFFVQLENTVEGLVQLSTLKDDYYNYDPANFSLMGERTHKIYKLGQKVRIKVLAADKEKQIIDFVVAGARKRR